MKSFLLPSFSSKIKVNDFQCLERTKSIKALLNNEASGYRLSVKLVALLSYKFVRDM
jgi:hypothetical protein